MNWSLADVEKASKPKGAAHVQRKQPEPIPVPPNENEAIVAPETPLSELRTLPTPAFFDPVTHSATWLFDAGRLSVSLAHPHGRQRLAIAGAPDEALVAALLATVEAHFATPLPTEAAHQAP